MPYLERLREAGYRSPSGAEFTFQFQELERSGSKKAPIHEFPQQDLPEVQDLGQAAVHFGIKAVFTGEDYDLTADDFWKALAEHGPATLKHPRWGDLRVLPVTFAQAEGFVDGMRQAIFTIDFVRLGDIGYPTTVVQAESEIGAELEETGIEGIEVKPENALATAASKKSYTSFLTSFKSTMTAAISAIGDVREGFERLVNDFENTLDTLILDPITLAQSFIALVRAPARALTSISAKLQGYATAITNLKNTTLGIGIYYSEAASRAMQALGLMAGLAECTLTGTITTRTEAVQAIEIIQDSIIDALEAIEQIEAASDTYTTPSEVLAIIRVIIAQTISMLLERSFDLKIERQIILDSDRTPLDLVYELYGDLENLDDFIDYNRLNGDEIFMIPRGRGVIYYV